MGYNWQWDAVFRNWDILASGLWYTIIYTIAVVVLGLTLGTILALLRLSSSKLLNLPALAALEILRGVPLLVLLIWMYYAFPLLTGIRISAPTASIAALSLYGGAYYGEIIRGGILSIDTGQMDAGRSLGMTYAERMRRIIMPQAFRRMIPPLMNQSIINLKNTSLASVVTVAEMTYQAQRLSSDTYRSLEVYTLVAGLYLAIVLPSTFLVRKLESKNRSFGSAPRKKKVKQLSEPVKVGE